MPTLAPWVDALLTAARVLASVVMILAAVAVFYFLARIAARIFSRPDHDVIKRHWPNPPEE